MANNGSEESQAPSSISKDDAFHLLQNPRRRAVLRYLIEHDDQDQFTINNLAEEVAAWEYETTVADLTSDERQRVYIALYQSHLPKLDNYSIIEYDQERGNVKPTPLLAVLDPYLDDGLHAASDNLAVDDIETSDSESSPSLADMLRDLFRD